MQIVIPAWGTGWRQSGIDSRLKNQRALWPSPQVGLEYDTYFWLDIMCPTGVGPQHFFKGKQNPCYGRKK